MNNELYKKIAIWVWPELANSENWTAPDYSNDANSVTLLNVLRERDFGVALNDIGRDNWVLTIVNYNPTENRLLSGRGRTVSEAICSGIARLLEEI